MAQNGIDRARGCPIPTDASRLRLPPVTLVDLYLRFDEEPRVNWNTAKRDSIPSRFSVVIVACGRRGSVKIGGHGVAWAPCSMEMARWGDRRRPRRRQRFSGGVGSVGTRDREREKKRATVAASKASPVGQASFAAGPVRC